jgi:L-iditol 2-dehydrogenase
MRAAVLDGIRKIEITDIPEPRIEQKTDVLLRVLAVGICGSDAHYYTSGRIGSQVVKYPFRIGHECSATVIETGKSVRRVGPGDLVAVDPAVWCGKCDQCLAKRRHTCRNIKFLGTPGQANGCLCEYIVMPESSCYPVMRKTTPERAALVEPLSISCYSAGLYGDIEGKDIAVLGSGPIGLGVLLAAKLRGARFVYATDKLNYRLALAKTQGTGWTGNPEKQDVVKEILKTAPLQYG